MKLRCLQALVGLYCLFTACCHTCKAAEIRVIEKQTEPAFGGKEVDWIYGDFLMSNDQISLVIGAPLKTRDANLTVRNVGADDPRPLAELSVQRSTQRILSRGRSIPVSRPVPCRDRQRRQYRLLAMSVVEVAQRRKNDGDSSISVGRRTELCRGDDRNRRRICGGHQAV